MSEAIAVALIVALGASLPPTIIAALTWWSTRHIGAEVTRIEVNHNDKMAQFLALTKVAAIAEGTEAERTKNENSKQA